MDHIVFSELGDFERCHYGSQWFTRLLKLHRNSFKHLPLPQSSYGSTRPHPWVVPVRRCIPSQRVWLEGPFGSLVSARMTCPMSCDTPCNQVVAERREHSLSYCACPWGGRVLKFDFKDLLVPGLAVDSMDVVWGLCCWVIWWHNDIFSLFCELKLNELKLWQFGGARVEKVRIQGDHELWSFEGFHGILVQEFAFFWCWKSLKLAMWHVRISSEYNKHITT